jgi:hypothetical protein
MEGSFFRISLQSKSCFVRIEDVRIEDVRIEDVRIEDVRLQIFLVCFKSSSVLDM